ncbi:MAG: 30S ribosomal protein S11 [Patescibacteria group bacterium]
MGKKKITKQNETELMEETSKLESAVKKAAVVSAQRHTKSANIYIQATYNNTIMTATDNSGNALAWSSSGALGFKGAKKATPFAASKVAETVVEKIRKSGLQDVSVYVKGIGSGRESAVRSLLSAGLNVSSVTDTTPIPHNGCRPPKVRRI